MNVVAGKGGCDVRMKWQCAVERRGKFVAQARLAQSVERQALNLMVVGSSPTVGAFNEGRAQKVCAVMYLRGGGCGVPGQAADFQD